MCYQIFRPHVAQSPTIMHSALPEDGNLQLPRQPKAPWLMLLCGGLGTEGDASAFRLIATLGSAGQDLIKERSSDTFMSFPLFLSRNAERELLHHYQFSLINMSTH